MKPFCIHIDKPTPHTLCLACVPATLHADNPHAPPSGTLTKTAKFGLDGTIQVQLYTINVNSRTCGTRQLPTLMQMIGSRLRVATLPSRSTSTSTGASRGGSGGSAGNASSGSVGDISSGNHSSDASSAAAIMPDSCQTHCCLHLLFCC